MWKEGTSHLDRSSNSLWFSIHFLLLLVSLGVRAGIEQVMLTSDSTGDEMNL